MPVTFGRDQVVQMLASYGDRTPEAVPETIDSLELAWLIHQVEQRYGVLDLSDDELLTMSTVETATQVLSRAVAGR